MAKILGKDEATYSKERDGFLRDLQHFHETRGTPFRRCPTLGGKEIDLYLLYSLVTAQGGWIKVNSKNTWPDLLLCFKLPCHCVNGSVALKQIYLRYLDRWEKVHFLGEEADRCSDDDEESRHKRWSARALHWVPYTYNYSQHNVAETNREYNHLSTDLYKPSEYDRLALSLISPLPNEQDFAINVCTLLSNDSKRTLKLDKHPRIINYLLAHAGVYNHSSLRRLFTHHYKDVRKKPFQSFWNDVLESDELLDLTNETKFGKLRQEEESPPLSDSLIRDDVLSIPGVNERIIDDKTTTSEVRDSDSDCEVVDDISGSFKLKLEPNDSELFCLKRTLGTQDYIGQRVLQIATILRNLCYIEENLPVLTKNVAFLRFLLLCASSQWNILRNLGMDMLGNIAVDYMLKDLQSEILAESLMKVVSKNLQSQDRAACLASIEVLNKLSQNEKNEDILLRSLESSIYKRVCSFLTIHDVMLLIYTLECLYSLSSLGERSCTFIANNHGVIDTLVSLVTVEGKSYGPRACIGMKLVETIPSGSQSQQQQQNQPQVTTTASTTSSSSSNTSSSTTTSNLTASVSTTTTATSTPVVSSIQTATKTVTPSTPVRTVAIAPQRLLAPTPSTSASTSTPTPPTVVTHAPTIPQTGAQIIQSLTPQQLIQQQHAHQQAIQENEQFALAWLRATYEPAGNGKIDHQELYKHYISTCSKIGRRGVISPLHFPRCVRSVFGGTVGPNPMKPANPNDPQYYEGIKVMAHPHLSQALLGTSSANSSSTSVTTLTTLSAGPSKESHHHQQQQQTIQHQASQQHQQGQSSSTSLIKSLLATKVNDCMSSVSMKTATDCQNVAQVAARQQRLLAQQGSNAQTPEHNSQQKSQSKLDSLRMQRINGARQLFSETEINDPSVSSTTQFASTTKGKKEPPQPPPPPLAPLSNNVKSKTPPVINEDSDSIGNTSLSSTSGLGALGVGCVSSTEDCDNSLTSFEGLLNGVPNVEAVINEDSNSKDYVKVVSNEITIDKPLRLADLLEKSFEKSPPLLNGTLGKELKLEDGLDLVENHIEKALSRDNHFRTSVKSEIISLDEDSLDVKSEVLDVKEEPIEISMEDSSFKQYLKRPASDDIVESQAKRPHLSTNVNGSGSAGSPAPDSVSSSNGEDGPATVSTAAAKLFADMAADILEDEDEEQLMQEAQAPNVPMIDTSAGITQSSLQQIIMENSQPMLLSQPRQIIVSQGQIQQANQSIMISAGTHLKTQSGQTVIVQNPSSQQRQPMLIQQANTGQILLSQGLQGQMQLVASSQPGQYVLQSAGAQGYMVAQPQTAMVHGQPQTVLVAQTSQQQGTAAKTIIILQQQTSNTATHHQKVVVTPQGQQVVVTQVPRPVIHSSTVSNNLQAPKTIKPAPSTTPVITVATSNGVVEKKAETQTPQPSVRKRVIKDLGSPYICEWGDCDVETKFKSANDVYMHVCAAHCPTGSEEIMCQWERCDNMKRKRFSLMTHLHDKHCNTDAMKQSLVRRKQIAQGAKVDPVPQASTSPHPGYAPDAALHAIKRHALEFVNPKELQDDNEGPVTKSIRLTASLILRNLVIYSSYSKRYLKSYESHLANVALSNVESSRTIAQILYDINDGSTHR